jgi:L(+)-tartrate dehydratase beta subunit
MGDSTGKRRTLRLKTPLAAEDIASFRLGDVVYLDGLVYTGREGVYKRVVDEGADLPVDPALVGNVNFHCSPAAAVRDDGSYNVGAVTATASFRFAKWLDRWFEISGCKVIIGKGGMTSDAYRKHFVPQGAVYLTTVGYGTGALLGRGIKRVVAAHWLEDLGIAQAMWVFEVVNFGPFLVESDLQGNSLFERANAEVAKNLDRLYKGLKAPVMRRYGETDERKDELI